MHEDSILETENMASNVLPAYFGHVLILPQPTDIVFNSLNKPYSVLATQEKA